MPVRSLSRSAKRGDRVALMGSSAVASWEDGSWESIRSTSAYAVRYMSDEMRRKAARLSEASSEENRKGIYLALCSSIFIGASFIIKKKGLMVASQSGATRAGAGGYSYLLQPLWWVGMCTMIGGEAANFAAYAYAPAIVVTPLGASTIIISAILANCFLGETLHECGILACCLAIIGSLVLLSHAPAEAPLESVEEIWKLATQPQFLAYAACVILVSVLLMYRYAPQYGRTHLLIYVLICSLIGSLSVVSCKVRIQTFRSNKRILWAICSPHWRLRRRAARPLLVNHHLPYSVSRHWGLQ